MTAGSRDAASLRRLEAHSLGLLYMAGATIGLISLLLPHPSRYDEVALYSNVGIAYLGGALILALGPRAPRWCFHLALLAGSVIITRAVFVSHDPVSFYSVWYVWVGLYAFYFFDRRAAIAHVAIASSLFGLTLIHDPPSSAVARWMTTVMTLCVAGVFLDALLRRARRQAEIAADTAATMAAVAAAAHRLSARADGGAARSALCAVAAEVTGATLVEIWEPDPATGSPEVTASTAGSAGSTDADDAALVARALADGTPAHVGRSSVQPVVVQGAVPAALRYTWVSAASIQTQRVRSALELLSAETAAMLQRIGLLERLEAMARTDELTGLPNRRAWQEALAREITRARRHGQPLCVAILDLDHFKAYNDTHGHQAGDRLLKQTAASWRDELRPTDLLARYGGEEFALALPDTGPEEASAILARLRESCPDDARCSAGAAWWDGAESAADLLGRADAALYGAKRDGRDRVVLAVAAQA